MAWPLCAAGAVWAAGAACEDGGAYASISAGTRAMEHATATRALNRLGVLWGVAGAKYLPASFTAQPNPSRPDMERTSFPRQRHVRLHVFSRRRKNLLVESTAKFWRWHRAARASPQAVQGCTRGKPMRPGRVAGRSRSRGFRVRGYGEVSHSAGQKLRKSVISHRCKTALIVQSPDVYRISLESM